MFVFGSVWQWPCIHSGTGTDRMTLKMVLSMVDGSDRAQPVFV